jgi:hypothetical protein
LKYADHGVNALRNVIPCFDPIQYAHETALADMVDPLHWQGRPKRGESQSASDERYACFEDAPIGVHYLLLPRFPPAPLSSLQLQLGVHSP